MTYRPSNSTPPTPRVVVIGLDMGDGKLIRHWVDRGELPHLAALIQDGVWLDLESPAEVLHTSTWPTFATGVLPGRHGVYYPFQSQPGKQQAEHIQPDQYGVPTFWSRADREGRRCLVYDVPETFPEADFSGHGIFEWGTWAWYGEQQTQPESLLNDLKARFGPYPLKLEATRLGLKFPEPVALEKRLLKSIEHKAASFQWLLGQDAWDLAVVAFCETHPAGHYLFPAGATAPEQVDGAMLRVYQGLDAALGGLKRDLPVETVFMVVSGDGVRPNYCGWHLLPEVLERLDYTRAVKPQGEGEGAKGSGISLRSIKGLVPPAARRFIADHLPGALREKINAGLQTPIDWSTTRAFTLPTDLEGYIRINLKGREPNGIVQPGRDYERLCAEIRQALEELINPATGEPAVARVWARNEIYPGPMQDTLPDLIVSWNDASPITALSSARMGTVEGPSPDPRTGTHSTRGFMVLSGADVVGPVSGMGRLVDVAPTVLSLVGIDSEPNMDGQPLTRGAMAPGAAAGAGN